MVNHIVRPSVRGGVGVQGRLAKVVQMVMSAPKYDTKRQGVALWVAIVLSATLGGYSAALVADRNVPVDVMSAEATTPFVAPGGTLRVGYTVYRRKQCDVFIDRFIIDAAGTRHTLPDSEIKRGLPLGPDRYGVLADVPEKAVLGPATYMTITSYVCNVFQLLSAIPGGTQKVDFTIR